MNNRLPLDIQAVRSDFPILSQKVYGKPLIYLDNGATTQKPQVVIDTLTRIYTNANANIHRGLHYLSEQITEEYEQARQEVQIFLNASSSQEIIFTAGSTASINAVAFSYGEQYIKEGDEIIVSAMEHHSNIVPWQMLCSRKKASLKVIPINDVGELLIDEYQKMLSARTRLVAITHISNTLGTINPIKTIVDMAHRMGAHVLVDGAQAVQHLSIDVQDIDCDFYVFSGHKLYGPTGIGVLYGKKDLLDVIPPYQGGGDMVDRVRFEKTTYNELPLKFEAGTANYADAIALKAAIQYIRNIGIGNIQDYEQLLSVYICKQMHSISDLKVYGTSTKKIATYSFLLKGVHAYDTGLILDKLGIAVRTGTHCTQPLMDRFGIEGTVRASFAFYNTFQEVDLLCEGLERVKKMFN